jgi:uncharacterized integral membrane protein (TIGR00698 family)
VEPSSRSQIAVAAPARGTSFGAALRWQHALVALSVLLSLIPAASAAVGLLLGIAVASIVDDEARARAKAWSKWLLPAAVVGLGAGMDFAAVIRVGAHGILYTLAGISICLTTGVLLGRRLRVPLETTLLISVGTAICGGSAIAAAAPALRARSNDVTASLTAVFLLNGLALFLFPMVGHLLHLDPQRFGMWAALAIHDTSSVVGAAVSFDPHSVEIATTMKLARALWIVPVVFGVSQWRARREEGASAPVKLPWFILLFLLAAALVTLLPALRPAGLVTAMLSRRALVIALFLIGASTDLRALRRMGARPLLHASLLWVVMAALSLAAVAHGLLS